MTRKFSLQPLQELSRTRLDDATSELGRLIAHEQEGERKLEMLQEYRAEYEARFRAAMHNGLGIEAIRNYSAFMNRIDDAIAAQQAHVGQSRHQTEAGKQNWVEHRNRAKAFDTLAQRHQDAERRRSQKLEQRQSDEHTAVRHQRNETDGGEQ